MSFYSSNGPLLSPGCDLCYKSGMTPAEEARLIDILNQGHEWPCLFAFKFIVPHAEGPGLRALIPEADRVDERASSGGKYTAFTFHTPMGSAREVLDVYARVRGIPGLVSL